MNILRMKKIFPVIVFILTLSCSSDTGVAAQNNPGSLNDLKYYVSDEHGNIKAISFRDSVLATGDTAVLYSEIGDTIDLEMEVVFLKSNWQAIYCSREDALYEGSGELEWFGNRIIGYSESPESEFHDIDRIIDDFSVSGWFLPVAFMGIPFENEDWQSNFDLVTPDLNVYGFKAEYIDTETVETPEGFISCHKLFVDGRGIYSFGPDIYIHYRIEEPHIPIRCNVADRGFVFNYYSDSLKAE